MKEFVLNDFDGLVVLYVIFEFNIFFEFEWFIFCEIYRKYVIYDNKLNIKNGF